MPSRQYTLFKAFTASGDAAVSVQILQSGRIKCVQFCTLPVLNADDESYQIELATVPTMQSRTHGSQGAIATVGQNSGMVTSGLNAGGVNVAIPVDVPVEVGQLLYVNAMLSGTNDVSVSIIVTIV